MKMLLATSFFIIIGQNCFAQNNYPTSDSIHIFWQPGLIITFADYKGPLTQEMEGFMKIYDVSVSASVGIWSILDIPKKKKDRYRKFEKVYFAPAFERTTSYAKSNDSLQIAMQNIYLDICELCARGARRELISIQDSMKSTGALSVFYSTAKQDMEKMKLEMYRGYFKDVFIDKKEGAFAWWRKLIDRWLEESKDYATTKEECYRLLSGKPIEEGYIQAPTVMGPLFDNR
ncbi:MAG: hypothetical protein WAT91_01780 [Saprospiraceae bacterium]